MEISELPTLLPEGYSLFKRQDGADGLALFVTGPDIEERNLGTIVLTQDTEEVGRQAERLVQNFVTERDNVANNLALFNDIPNEV